MITCESINLIRMVDTQMRNRKESNIINIINHQATRWIREEEMNKEFSKQLE
jgi:hypothetical protein